MQNLSLRRGILFIRFFHRSISLNELTQRSTHMHVIGIRWTLNVGSSKSSFYVFYVYTFLVYIGFAPTEKLDIAPARIDRSLKCT